MTDKPTLEELVNELGDDLSMLIRLHKDWKDPDSPIIWSASSERTKGEGDTPYEAVELLLAEVKKKRP